MRLFERADHIAQSRSMLSACLQGEGQALLIHGLAATGRTALLRHVVSDAEQAGMRVMQATCAQTEKELAGSVLSQLLSSIRASGELAEREVPSYRGFCREILSLAARDPLIIAVDDVRHADDESMQCLLYLSRRIGAARVLLVLACRREDEGSYCPHMTELVRQPGVRQLAVAPLSAVGVTQLLSERLGRQAATPAIAAKMHYLSGGNLGLLQALIDDYLRAHPESTEFVAERGYGGALVGLLKSWSPRALRIAQALAALGELGAPERVAQLAAPYQDVTVDVVERTIATWTEAGLLHAGRFPHPAGPAAVLGTVMKGERAALYQRSAHLLHGLGESAQTVACYLAEADQRVEPWAVQVLVEAAEHELLAGRNQLAGSYLALAHESCDDAAEQAAILRRLTDVEWQWNPLKAARNLASLVAASKAGHLPPEALPDLVWQLLWFGSHQEAVAVLDTMRAAEPTQPALTAETSNLHTWLTASHPKVTRLWRYQVAARPPSGESPAEPCVTGLHKSDPWLALTASLCELYASGRVYDHAEWIEQSLGGLRPRGNSAWAREAASIALLGLLDIGLADAVLAQCSALSTPDRYEEERAWQAQLRALRAEALLRKGDLGGAVGSARKALTLLPPLAWGVAVGLPLGTLITAATRSGDLEEAGRCLAISPPKAMLESRHGLYYLHACGQYHLASQRAHAGLADFLACGDLVRALGLDTAEPVLWRTSAAEALLRLGNHERAYRLVREELAYSGAANGGGRGRALRILAALSSPQRRPHMLLEALESLEGIGDQYEQARVLADLSRAYSSLGDSRRARTTLRRARFLAQSCGATLLSEDLLAIQGPEEAPASCEDKAHQLTEAERRVAHLATLGYTNRDIAAKLYVTASTVEQHLTRIYRKFNIKSRKDLPTGLGATMLRQPQRAHPPAARHSAS